MSLQQLHDNLAAIRRGTLWRNCGGLRLCAVEHGRTDLLAGTQIADRVVGAIGAEGY